MIRWKIEECFNLCDGIYDGQPIFHEESNCEFFVDLKINVGFIDTSDNYEEFGLVTFESNIYVANIYCSQFDVWRLMENNH